MICDGDGLLSEPDITVSLGQAARLPRFFREELDARMKDFCRGERVQTWGGTGVLTGEVCARHAGGLLQTEGTEARLPRRGDVIRTEAAALTLVRGIEA